MWFHFELQQACNVHAMANNGTIKLTLWKIDKWIEFYGQFQMEWMAKLERSHQIDIRINVEIGEVNCSLRLFVDLCVGTIFVDAALNRCARDGQHSTYVTVMFTSHAKITDDSQCFFLFSFSKYYIQKQHTSAQNIRTRNVKTFQHQILIYANVHL